MTEFLPREFVDVLLAGGSEPRQGDGLDERTWQVRWDLVPERERQRLLASLPPSVGFRTSGHTGDPVLWLRSRQQLLAEVQLLRDVCRLDRQDGVITFAPPHHLYGFLLSFLLPAVRGLPTLFLPAVTLSREPCGLREPLVVAIPSTLAALDRTSSGVLQCPRLTIVHSTASLPPSADSLCRRLGDRLDLVELFGSTETGAVAVRRPRAGGTGPWWLMPDVEFATIVARGQETRLEVRGPRIAAPAAGSRPARWRLDDHVRVLGPRSFLFEGRRSRLVNVNGRRLDLDAIEHRLREQLADVDVACLPMRDPLRGESYELQVAALASVPAPDTGDLRTRCRRLLAAGERPRSIRVVPKIERTATGKVRALGSRS